MSAVRITIEVPAAEDGHVTDLVSLELNGMIRPGAKAFFPEGGTFVVELDGEEAAYFLEAITVVPNMRGYETLSEWQARHRDQMQLPLDELAARREGTF